MHLTISYISEKATKLLADCIIETGLHPASWRHFGMQRLIVRKGESALRNFRHIFVVSGCNKMM